ncbi:Nucleotide-binding universal stress protein, UspA family [Marinococcus luteus]|uniref:Nucleotide-binding universal stress protein, UspA family n=1 Tax=Marinococcus luteus TaxID=1122204 RepID=A0A1H2QK33_9BACI|nr:universal stress protein [Marinococcus luteus]SDW07516.1 Nucleotide-binding universal stress protein, UspA family [Marinococcus luteus]
MSHYQRILVGIDAVEIPTYKVFDEAKAMAAEHGATLIIAFVFDQKRYATLERMDPKGIERLRTKAALYLEACQQAAWAQGIEHVETVMDSGAPKKRLATDLARRYEADAIIIGESGGTRLERLVFGHTSKAIRRKAKCDVHVVQNS